MKTLRTYLVVGVLWALTVLPANADVVGLWRFDAEADPQPDSSSFGNNAMVIDAAWENDAVRGGVMNFEGQGDSNPVEWLEVEDSDSLSIEETGLTIAAWANFTEFDSFNSIVSKNGSDNRNYPAPYDLYTSNAGAGLPQFYAGADVQGGIAQVLAAESGEVEEWIHIAVTMDEEGEVVHYLNGEENGIGFIDREAILLEDSDNPLFIGSRLDGATNMHGMLDDVAIFNEALTEADILTIMGGDFSKWGVGDVVAGDFNMDGSINDADIDLLSAEVRTGGTDLAFDLTGDAMVDDADRTNWVVDVNNTWFGDSNLDGEFNSADFVMVFSRGQYEDAVAGNSGWADGDWNGDGDFNSTDFVAAFSDGGYEKGVRTPAAAVPEPATATLALLGCLTVGMFRRRSV